MVGCSRHAQRRARTAPDASRQPPGQGSASRQDRTLPGPARSLRSSQTFLSGFEVRRSGPVRGSRRKPRPACLSGRNPGRVPELRTLPRREANGPSQCAAAVQTCRAACLRPPLGCATVRAQCDRPPPVSARHACLRRQRYRSSATPIRPVPRSAWTRAPWTASEPRRRRPSRLPPGRPPSSDGPSPVPQRPAPHRTSSRNRTRRPRGRPPSRRRRRPGPRCPRRNRRCRHVRARPRPCRSWPTPPTR